MSEEELEEHSWVLSIEVCGVGHYACAVMECECCGKCDAEWKAFCDEDKEDYYEYVNYHVRCPGCDEWICKIYDEDTHGWEEINGELVNIYCPSLQSVAAAAVGVQANASAAEAEYTLPAEQAESEGEKQEADKEPAEEEISTAGTAEAQAAASEEETLQAVAPVEAIVEPEKDPSGEPDEDPAEDPAEDSADEPAGESNGDPAE
ncbi:MAG: hypothetical protein LIO67_01810 [Lachnospiraceae bacterium]|nr:hypothetical protein [Lachnospiraceae bacterium]